MVDRFVRIWNVADGKETKKLGPTPDDTFGMALSPDGKLAATCGYGGHLTIWNVAEGKQAAARKLPKYGAYCVRFTPDGKSVVTGHDNGMCYLTAVGA
jgi:WD40 repeat protein